MPQQRVWRMRTLHQSIDAEIHEAIDGSAEVHFFLNGEFTYARRCPSRELALAEAAAKREELERDGWTFHW
jgi:hypothetical protein